METRYKSPKRTVAACGDWWGEGDLEESRGPDLQLCLHCLSLEVNPRVYLGWRPARYGSAGLSCLDSGVGETLRVKSRTIVKLI